MKEIIYVIIMVALIVGCTPKITKEVQEVDLKKFDKANFAGGCFWCIEEAFQGYDFRCQYVPEGQTGYLARQD